MWHLTNPFHRLVWVGWVGAGPGGTDFDTKMPFSLLFAVMAVRMIVVMMILILKVIRIFLKMTKMYVSMVMDNSISWSQQKSNVDKIIRFL